jgi:oligopeptidase B
VLWYWESARKGFKVINIAGQTLFVLPRIREVYSLYPSAIVDEEARLIRDFNSTTFTFSNSSFVESLALYVYHFDSGKIELIAKESYEDAIDLTAYQEFKEFIPIEDGKRTRIPVSIVYKRDKDQGDKGPFDRPMILKSYGAYGGMIEPKFDVANIPMIERGFIIAFAHVRGDGDFGYAWYLDGKLEKKQNSIDDFFAVIEHVLRLGWTSSEKLAIYGRSAGGIIIGAAVNRLEPGKIQCAVAQVPFVDAIGSMIDATVPWTSYEW